MARIRTLKPEFFRDEKVATLSDAHQLLAVALITMADDAGRVIDSVVAILGNMRPFADEESIANHSREIRDGLAMLSRIRFIRRGWTASDQKVIQIANWSKHQKVDKPNLKACLPEIVRLQEDSPPRESVANDSRTIRDGFARDSRPDLDLRPTTYDLRPTTVEDESSRNARDSAATPATSGRELFLAEFNGTHQHRWRMLIHGWSEGMGTSNGKAIPDAAIDAGISEFLARHPTGERSPVQVLRFVEHVANRKPLNGTGRSDSFLDVE